MKEYNGIYAEAFRHISEISFYNHNYYIGLKRNSAKNDLLYAESDDDNSTEWYIMTNGKLVPFAESFTSENDKLYVYNEFLGSK